MLLAVNHPRREAEALPVMGEEVGEMPKELINTSVETDETADGTVLETRTDRLYVSWGRQPWFAETAPPAPEVVQMSVSHETITPNTSSAHEVYSAGLSRREINELIRVLRKARDQTFGTDV